MYVEPDYPTKKALKEAIKDGKTVCTYSPGPFPCPLNGEISVEGPHYPKPHSWYARVKVEGGSVVKVVS